MNSQKIEALRSSLGDVSSFDDFQDWVRKELRRTLPHATFLGTMGRLLGIGSIPTHRISVDCPMNLVETLKNNSGAIDDPLMFRWFKSGKPNYANVLAAESYGEQSSWRGTLLAYGIRAMSIHGILDHQRRRFAVFQLGNPFEGASVEYLKMLGALSDEMARAAWRSIETRSDKLVRGVVCNPTLGLTVTELHIIELLAQGLSNKEIARRRGVSDSTIKTQVQRTGAKLGATRRAEIVAIAMPMLSPLPAQSMIDYDDF